VSGVAVPPEEQEVANRVEVHSFYSRNRSTQQEGASTMEETCENLAKCGFFVNFKSNTEVVKNSWVRLYCESKAKSENCERKKIKRQTGKPPADNMAPTGKILG
jgi:hypothetical protein